MMTDSDDTDVLLLIPPDLFHVHSSDSEDSFDSSYRQTKSRVVSEIIEHMQSLDSRLSAIESKDDSNDSLNLSQRLSLDPIMSSRQTLPRTKFTVSRDPNLQKTPNKYPKCSPLSSTPSGRQQLNHTNETHTTRSHGDWQNNTPKSNAWNKHDNCKLFSEPVLTQTTSPNKSFLHAGVGCSEREARSMLLPALNVCENNVHTNSYNSLPVSNSSSVSANRLNLYLKPIKDMNSVEVEEYLREIEASDNNSTTRNDYYNELQAQMGSKTSPVKSRLIERDDRDKRKILEQKLKFNMNGHMPANDMTYQSDHEKRRDVSDLTVNDTSFSSLDTEKFMTDFKVFTPSFHESNSSKFSMTNLLEPKNHEDNDKFNSIQPSNVGQQLSEVDAQNYLPNSADFTLENRKENARQYFDSSVVSKFTDDGTKSQIVASAPGMNHDAFLARSCPSIFRASSNVSDLNTPGISLTKKPELTNHTPSISNSGDQTPINTMHNNEPRKRPQRLLTLSEFWNNDSKKSLEEQLRIKLEEERFRREHCEQLIQDLQKKLLEQQEKVAVAVRVDNEKNSLISQFQTSWKKMKQNLCESESERQNLQKVLKSISEKHQSEIAEWQEQMKTYKAELSKALNLATGYKEKSDSLVSEKVDLLKSHADELQNYKSMVQEAESRYEELKVECQKLADKNQRTDETLKAVQQDLSKELLKSSEVRSEMAVIHKALDACETELTILRQEKENLQLKLREEVNRNNILEQGKASLVQAVDEAKKAEKVAKNELRSLTEQHENIRAELRDVYQKQVDEVVKNKLQEFQTQLDSAETHFQNEVDMKQRAIAECAARKIKSFIDKHQLEINLIEEKHKEEKKLCEIKLAQAVQKATMLEAQLNSYRKSKNQLVEQLHIMMQKQWQQALLIISGGNTENVPSFQKINVDKLFEFPNEANLDLVPNHYSNLCSEPMRLESQKSAISLRNMQSQERQNESLITLTSHEDTPVTSRKESKNDLKKYIKMILDMQQAKDDYSKPKFFNGSPPSSCRENSSKQSVQKDINTSNDGSSTWQPVSEMSVHDTSEYFSVPQNFTPQGDQQKCKPPWK